MKNGELRDVCQKVRAQFVLGEVYSDALQKLYLCYNPNIVQPSLFMRRAQEYFPQYNCGLASVYLQSLIGGVVIQGKYSENDHTFLLRDGLVIDITADQFGGPEIYIGPPIQPWIIKKVVSDIGYDLGLQN